MMLWTIDKQKVLYSALPFAPDGISLDGFAPAVEKLPALLRAHYEEDGVTTFINIRASRDDAAPTGYRGLASVSPFVLLANAFFSISELERLRAHSLELNTPGGPRRLTEEEAARADQEDEPVARTEEQGGIAPLSPQPEEDWATSAGDIPPEVLAELGEGFGEWAPVPTGLEAAVRRMVDDMRQDRWPNARRR